MKTTKLVALGFISMSALALGVQSVHATDVKPGKSQGQVNLDANWEEGGIVSPEGPGPETVEPPVTPPIVGDSELALMYYPSFDFGSADYDETNGNTLYATPFVSADDQTTLPQFAQVRSTVVDWSLNAQAGEFVNDEDGTQVLKGAQILLNDVSAVQNTSEKVGSAATATTGTLNLSNGGGQVIGTFNNPETDGVSRNSFLFGKVTDDGYQGVELDIPAGLSINEENGGYTANLTWTLSSDSI